jgi:hypothetical protein
VNVCTSYVLSRGLPESIITEWCLGYGQWSDQFPQLRDRLTVPIAGYTETAFAIAGRTLTEEKPKWWNTPFSKSRWLYGLWKPALSAPILVESYLDVWALRLLGYTGYAVMASEMSPWQAAHVAGRFSDAIVYPHADTTGNQWLQTLSRFGVRAFVPWEPYPQGMPSDADAHWLYVNQRDWLLSQVKQVEEMLQHG